MDGFFVGTVDDVTQNGLLLRAGRHWIDLRAEGYETLTVPVTHRRRPGDSGIAASSSPPARSRQRRSAVRTPQTIYVIAGATPGTSRPSSPRCPRGCDIANLRTLTLR